VESHTHNGPAATASTDPIVPDERALYIGGCDDSWRDWFQTSDSKLLTCCRPGVKNMYEAISRDKIGRAKLGTNPSEMGEICGTFSGQVCGNARWARLP